MKLTRAAWLAGGLAVLAGIGAALTWQRPAPPLQLVAGSYLAPSRTLPDFSLLDQHGRAFGPANLRGHWSLMLFGYTNCPGFCPATLAQLAALEKQLRDGAIPVLPQVVFMSVDARRDTPEQLAKYLPNFAPDFIGLTAPDQPAIEAVAAKLGVAVLITPQGDGTYSVDHSNEIYVLDPAGKIAAILSGPFTVNGLRTDFQRIVARRA